MTFVSGPVAIRVPATSANLGPGFDCLGLALALYDDLEAEVVGPPGAAPTIVVEGEGEQTVPLDPSHLVYRSTVRALEALGSPVPQLRLRCRNAVPHGRGLGSSSAAIVGGLALGRALVPGGVSRMDDQELFRIAARIEGHPDNVAPAVFGGFTLAYEAAGRFEAVCVPVTSAVAFVVHVPVAPLETEVARGLLPATVSHADATHNASRAALVVAGLSGRPDVLLDAIDDRLHQPYRAAAMPESAALLAALRGRGLPAAVSGAGPSVLVMSPPDRVEEALEAVPQGWRAHRLDLDEDGVRPV